MATTSRDKRGRFSKSDKSQVRLPSKTFRKVQKDHNYNLRNVPDAEIQSYVSAGQDSWKTGRRIVEFGVLLSNLQTCKQCRLGPVPLTVFSVLGELKKGVSGYLYVQCTNSDCRYVNCVPYGKTHHVKERGMPCFAVNTKLGTAMIDSVGGPNRVNNFLSALNIQTVSNPSLKKMERRAGEFVERVSRESCTKAAKETYEKEMEDVAQLESTEAQVNMENLISDLGVSTFPDSSPNLKLLLQKEGDGGDDSYQWTDVSDDEEAVVGQQTKPTMKPKKRKIQMSHEEGRVRKNCHTLAKRGQE